MSETFAVAPEANTVAVEIGEELVVLDADDVADLRGMLGVALAELRVEQQVAAE